MFNGAEVATGGTITISLANDAAGAEVTVSATPNTTDLSTASASMVEPLGALAGVRVSPDGKTVTLTPVEVKEGAFEYQYDSNTYHFKVDVTA